MRVGLVEFGERHDTQTNGQHYIAADLRLISQVSVNLNEEVARHTRRARHSRISILASMSRVSGVSTRMSRGCYKETAAMEFKLYEGNITRLRW